MLDVQLIPLLCNNLALILYQMSTFINFMKNNTITTYVYMYYGILRYVRVCDCLSQLATIAQRLIEVIG